MFTRVLLIESAPMLGLDGADAPETVGLDTVGPDFAAAFTDIPLPSRPARAGDVVAAVAQALPMRSSP